MVVHADSGKFITQRQIPKLCQVCVSLPPEALLASNWGQLQPGAALVVSAPSMPQLQVPLTDPAAPAPPAQLKNVTVWEWSGVAADEGDEAAAWFSKYLGRPVRLVRHLHSSGLPQTVRPVDPDFAPGHNVKFADGFPLLIIPAENLADLNCQLSSNGSTPLPMTRFRPNLVLAGVEGAPWGDDGWASVAVGGAQLSYVKPCSRCKVTTIDQETGEEGTEPLRTLGKTRSGKVLGWAAKHKSWTHEVFFGWNAAVAQQGTISVGNTVAVIQARA
eukprot:GHRQ01008893.1.p1 GENE.GHRQ01008893.1~~GHRQ01008893.1.p1  ORF type:complete len:274 (+),score=117.08 GHRQ01008893.1:309-1130(+)